MSLHDFLGVGLILLGLWLSAVASALAPLELRGKLVVSIAAGVPLMAIEIAAGNPKAIGAYGRAGASAYLQADDESFGRAV